MTPPIATLSVPWTNQGDAFARRDDAEALIEVQTGRSWTYAELIAETDAAARAFAAQDLPPKSRIAIVGANSASVLFAVYGAMRAGHVAVPVNWKLPAATVGAVIEDCGATLILHDAPRLVLCPSMLPAGRPTLIDLDSPWRDPGRHALPHPNPHDPALFLYTSGSTGRPKGVVLSHHSHLWVLDVRIRAGAKPAHTLVAAPLYHMNALSTVQAAWATGGAVILLPGFDPASYIEAAATHRATALTAVPTMIAMMVRDPALATADLSTVATVRIGSAPFNETLVTDIHRVFPGAALLNGYGTTEAGPVVFTPGPGQPLTSVGLAHPEVQLRLMHDGEELQGEGEGELEMRCPALMTEYHNLPEATARAMTEDGFYRTGDVFHRDAAGFHSFRGRADDMFNSAGENIYPSEVEAVLARHKDLHQVAVVPIPDELKGHKPVAFVVTRPGAAPTEQELKQFVLANAPAYHHPRRIWFVDQLPLAGTNKIDRRALIERATQEGLG